MTNGIYYAVEIESSAGKFLAQSGSGDAPMLYRRRPDASKFRRELKKHIASRMKVVRILATFNVLNAA
jgi:hypothetical protein